MKNIAAGNLGKKKFDDAVYHGDELASQFDADSRIPAGTFLGAHGIAVPDNLLGHHPLAYYNFDDTHRTQFFGRGHGQFGQPTHTLEPVSSGAQSHHAGAIFVNPKQYKTIEKRRAKKFANQKKNKNLSIQIKKKFKYDSRSAHAKKRLREKDGKFVKKNNAEDTKTVATTVKAEEEFEAERPRPCFEQEEQTRRQERVTRRTESTASDSRPRLEKQISLRLEMEELNNLELDLQGDRGSPEGLPEEAPTLMRHDSLFKGK